MNLAQTNPPLTPPRRGTGQLVRSPPGRGWAWVYGPNAFEKRKEAFHEHGSALFGDRREVRTAFETMILVGASHAFDEPLLPENVLRCRIRCLCDRHSITFAGSMRQASRDQLLRDSLAGVTRVDSQEKQMN